MGKDLLAALTKRTGDVVAVVLAAALMVVSGVDHIHLWDIAYRHVATLGPLFLVQAVAALVFAVVIVATRLVIALLASALLMVGTIGGFIVADTVGLFGFKLPVVTNLAYLALSSEGLSTVILLLVVARALRAAKGAAVAPTPG
jgi:hypothetical protein